MEKAHISGIRIKIVSDGTCMGTKVIDAVTGEKLPNVKSVEWKIEARGLATCKLELVKMPVEVEANAADVSQFAPHEATDND